MPTQEEWKTYLTEQVQTIVLRPAMFGRESELTVVSLLEAWAFASGGDVNAPLDKWRVFCGELGTGSFYMRDWLESPFGRGLSQTEDFHEIERILGTHLAHLARRCGMQVAAPCVVVGQPSWSLTYDR